VIKAVGALRENLRFYGGMVRWVGFRTAKVTVQHGASARGRSSYTLGKLFKLAFDAVVAYTDKPLWLTIRFGFLMALASIVAGAAVLCRALLRSIPVPGWASLMVSLYFLGGVIIFVLGIVGLYVGKSFQEAKKRPLYVVQDAVNV
jgi:dolichol-phosphate mannosyltransferase